MEKRQNDLLYPNIFSSFPTLLAAQSTRQGGISTGHYRSLNLGKNTDDTPENIQQNRQLVAEKLGISWQQVAFAKQVHGTSIAKVENAGLQEGFDAMVTDKKGIFLAIGTADCAPILLFDAKNNVVAAIHAGWRGAAAKIASKTFGFMQNEWNTAASDCWAYIGPCISADVFEVGEEVAEQFNPVFSKKRKAPGKFLLDLKSALKSELLSMDFPYNQIEVSEYCTFSNTDDFFSHRKEQGKTGRMLCFIGIRA